MLRSFYCIRRIWRHNGLGLDDDPKTEFRFAVADPALALGRDVGAHCGGLNSDEHVHARYTHHEIEVLREAVGKLPNI